MVNNKKCILCKKEKTNFNSEHIIPKTLGGSYTIHNLCEECNIHLSDTIESKIKGDLFDTLNGLYKIKSRHKKYRNLIKDGEIIESNTGIPLIFKINKNGEIYMAPLVKIEKYGNNRFHINITDASMSWEYVKPFIKKEFSKIDKTLSKDNEEILKKHFNNQEIKTNDGKEFFIKDGEDDVLRPEMKKLILKIAYEIATDYYGSKYLDDIIGEDINKVLLSKLSINGFEKKYNPLFYLMTENTISNMNKIKFNEGDDEWEVIHAIIFRIPENNIQKLDIYIFGIFSEIIITKNADLYNKKEGMLVFYKNKNTQAKKYKWVYP
ncbi:HNH endonuclease [Methanobrevibacter sp. DSM 116169]|uniref:HNH endonuclease n=1 Tax=Methanobrevibacter sp. DSM 116169 TaxID=3242727 RepID=UPI0038FCFAEC